MSPNCHIFLSPYFLYNIDMEFGVYGIIKAERHSHKTGYMNLSPGQSAHIDGKDFTYCEFRVMSEVMKVKSHKEIAAALGKSVKTIDAQILGIYKKIGIHKIGEFYQWGRRVGFDDQGVYTIPTLQIPRAKAPVHIAPHKRKKQPK